MDAGKQRHNHRKNAIGAVFGTSNTFGIVRLYDHRGQPTVEIRFGQTADEPVTNFGKKCFSRRPLVSAAVRRFFAVSHCKYVSAATRTVGGWQHYHVPIVT
jgi:hypothetical protein